MRSENLWKERTLHGGIQKIYKFENGYGASVIKHSMSYGHEQGLWKLGVLEFYDEDKFRLCYGTEITDDVIGYLTEKQVNKLLEKIKKL